MKLITQINWGLIILYSIYSIYTLATLNRPGMDAAGRGMAGGFAIVFLVFCGILAGLNLIQYKWVKILVLILALIPILRGISYKLTLFMNTGSWG